MRIALYIAGHIRGYNKMVSDAIKKISDGHHLDVFIATHFSNNRALSQQPGNDVFYTYTEVADVFNDLPVRDMAVTHDSPPTPCCLGCKGRVAEYGPDTIVGENNQPHAATHCRKCKHPEMVVSPDSSYWTMWNNVWTCYQMSLAYEKKHGFKYDYHIRSRPDIICMGDIDFDSLPTLDNCLIIGFGGTLGAPSDQFAIGSGAAWADYCDIDRVTRDSLWGHEMVAATLKNYPIYKHYQTGRIVSDANSPPTPGLAPGTYICAHDVRKYIEDTTLHM
jgi:hypothetical protein